MRAKNVLATKLVLEVVLQKMHASPRRKMWAHASQTVSAPPVIVGGASAATPKGLLKGAWRVIPNSTETARLATQTTIVITIVAKSVLGANRVFEAALHRAHASPRSKRI